MFLHRVSVGMSNENCIGKWKAVASAFVTLFLTVGQSSAKRRVISRRTMHIKVVSSFDMFICIRFRRAQDLFAYN